MTRNAHTSPVAFPRLLSSADAACPRLTRRASCVSTRPWCPPAASSLALLLPPATQLSTAPPTLATASRPVGTRPPHVAGTGDTPDAATPLARRWRRWALAGGGPVCTQCVHSFVLPGRFLWVVRSRGGPAVARRELRNAWQGSGRVQGCPRRGRGALPLPTSPWPQLFAPGCISLGVALAHAGSGAPCSWVWKRRVDEFRCCSCLHDCAACDVGIEPLSIGVREPGWLAFWRNCRCWRRASFISAERRRCGAPSPQPQWRPLALYPALGSCAFVLRRLFKGGTVHSGSCQPPRLTLQPFPSCGPSFGAQGVRAQQSQQQAAPRMGVTVGTKVRAKEVTRGGRSPGQSCNWPAHCPASWVGSAAPAALGCPPAAPGAVPECAQAHGQRAGA